MQTSNTWCPGAQSPRHKTVKSLEARKEVTTYQVSEPDFDALPPGESVSFSRDLREPEEKMTHDDKVTFRNGGSIQDRDNEGGLLITSPNGETHEASGWIDIDHNTGSPKVNFRTEISSGDYESWEQTFPSEGGSEIRMQPDEGGDVLVAVASDGTVTAREDDWGITDSVPSERKGPALIFDLPYADAKAVNPPVPLDWVIAR